MYKKILVCICAVLIVSTSFLAVDTTAEVSTSVVTTFKDITAQSTDKPPIIPLVSEDVLIAKNANFEMYLNKKTANVKFKDLSNGYIWSSLSDTENLGEMSPELKSFTQSIITCQYLTPAGAIKRSYVFQTGSKPVVYTPIENGVKIKVDFADAGFIVEFSVILMDYGFSINVPPEGLEVTGINHLNAIYVMPFFGSTYSDTIGGYMFTPDGSGSLVSYNNPRAYSNLYNGNIYGKDLSVEKEKPLEKRASVTPGQQVYMPVYGAVHGEGNNAFMAHISSGAEYSQISASPAGHIIDYNWIGTKFLYEIQYWQPTSSNQGFNTYSTLPNYVDVLKNEKDADGNPIKVPAEVYASIPDNQIDFYLLNGKEASYSGMATTYRNILIDKGVLTKKTPKDTDIPIKLDAIMSENKKVTFGTRDIVLTSTDDLTNWQTLLHDAGIDNVIISPKGYQKNGLSNYDIDNLNASKKVGGNDGFKEVVTKANEYGGILAMQIKLSSGYEQQLNNKDMIHHVNGAVTTTNIDRPMYNEINYQTFDAINKTADKMLDNPLYKNISVDEMAYMLNSDYNSDGDISRTEAITNIQNYLSKLDESTDNLLLESPNAYALQYADAIYNTPDSTSQLLFETQTVPFYQMVLSGCVDLYSPYLNYYSGTIDDQLKLIDYNMYPSYLLTGEYASLFADTNTTDVYASRFEDWDDIIVKDYNFVNNILKNVQGKSVVSRDVIAPNVVKNIYDDNSFIIVNYTSGEYKNGEITVAGKSASYFEGV